MASKGRAWSRDELILICNQYFSIPFGQMHSRNPTVIALAQALGRTPGSVAMKLVNFASLDPAHKARGVSGLPAVSRADREVWEEFRSKWSALALESEGKLSKLLAPPLRGPGKEFAKFPPPRKTNTTERSATVQIRTAQNFFRKVVLAAYGSKCCVTGIPIPDLLNASHIMPWSAFPEHRLDPRNGLCLAVHFDRAFDCGLITFSSDMRLVLSPELKGALPNEAIDREFVYREGVSLRLPERFAPSEKFLAYHREKIFRA
jgi:hypothetical protein